MSFDYKRSTPAEIQKKLHEVIEVSKGHLTLASRALKDVSDTLRPGEHIFAIGEGLYNLDMWLIVITDLRVILLSRGFLFGLKTKSIDLSSINGLKSSPGTIMSTLTIQDGERNVEIENIHRASAQFLENQIKACIKARKTGSSAQIVEEDDELAALADLVKKRESRIINDDEFDREKAKIMEKYLASSAN